MSSKHVSNVNWRKIIENFRSAYQVGAPWEILISELIANSIDANARRIDLTIEGNCPKRVRIIDDGKGMNKKEFEDYHDLGSLAKRKGGGIGWAGIGAKLYIDRCVQIYTETKSKKFYGASKWSFPKTEKAPVWNEVKPIGLLHGKHGTAVEVLIDNPKECSLLQEKEVEGSILGNYNFVLEPLGSTIIRLNERRILPFDPRENAENFEEFKIRLKGGEAYALFSIMKEDVPPGFGLISIIVYGKTVEAGYDFKQYASIKNPERISGYVRYDELVNAITTSKDTFNKKKAIWRVFEKKVGKQFADWLEKIGQRSRVDVDDGLESVAKEIEKDLNKVLNFPEIKDMNIDLFQKLSLRQATLKTSGGDIRGIEIVGQQPSRGVSPGIKGTEGYPVIGSEEGISIKEHDDGHIPAAKKQRRMRSGIKVAYQHLKEINERYFIDPGLQAIVINKSNPAFICAEFCNAVSFYTLESCIQVICEIMEDEEEKQKAVNRIYQAYMEMKGYEFRESSDE